MCTNTSNLPPDWSATWPVVARLACGHSAAFAGVVMMRYPSERRRLSA